MRRSGTLTSWNDERGFGFIASTDGGAELFVHISAFPADGSRPTVGERLTFELGHGRNGKPQAIEVQRSALGGANARTERAERNRRGGASWATRGLGLLLLIALGVYGFRQYEQHADIPSRQIETPATNADQSQKARTAGIPCDGRIYCSQMTSCTEAKSFLKNCPGVQMDGNHDGTPCEEQWCTSPFAK